MCVEAGDGSIEAATREEGSPVKSKPALQAFNGRAEKAAGPANPVAADQSAAASKQTPAAHRKPEAPAQASKSVRHAQRLSGKEKLVCRYCGSADLAPSFVKRRHARCRACFKQRYGSAAQEANATRTRKAHTAR